MTPLQVLNNLLVLLAIFAISYDAPIVQAIPVTINATNVTCDVTPLRRLMRCSNEDGTEVSERTLYVKDDYLVECVNECARLNREGDYPCFGFIFRGVNFGIPSRRRTCVFQDCDDHVATTTPGIWAIPMTEDCFATPKPTSSPSTAPSTAPTTSAPSSRPSSAPSLRPSVAPTTAAPTASPTIPSPTRSPQPPTSRPTRRVVNTLAPSDPPDTSSASPTRYPTSAPTTGTPSLSPVSEANSSSPTRYPTPAPTTLRPTSPPVFQSPSGILSSAPFNITLFTQLVPNTKLCMIARPQLNSATLLFSGFGGTANDCMKECQYDDGCAGVFFSTKLKQCMKSVQLETTDDSSRVDEFVDKWTVYVKKKSPIPYYANFCSQFASFNTCTNENSQGQCQWGVGDRGYNQMRYTDFGYCGRIACDKNIG